MVNDQSDTGGRRKQAKVIESLNELESGDVVFVDAPEPDVTKPPFPKGTVGSIETGKSGEPVTHVDAAVRGWDNNYELVEASGEIKIPDVGEVTVIKLSDAG